MELECLFIFNSLIPNEEFVKLLKFKICSSLKSGGDILFSKLKSKIDDRKFGVILILYFKSYNYMLCNYYISDWFYFNINYVILEKLAINSPF